MSCVVAAAAASSLSMAFAIAMCSVLRITCTKLDKFTPRMGPTWGPGQLEDKKSWPWPWPRRPLALASTPWPCHWPTLKLCRIFLF